MSISGRKQMAPDKRSWSSTGYLAYPGNPTNVGPYTATITQGGKTLAAINVPVHFYFSRWRWQSAPRPFVARVSALIASGLLPPFGASGIKTPPYNWTNKPYVIMGNAGIEMVNGEHGRTARHRNGHGAPGASHYACAWFCRPEAPTP